jgi:hypothetical protein
MLAADLNFVKRKSSLDGCGVPQMTKCFGGTTTERGIVKTRGKCYDFRHKPSYEITGSSHRWPVLIWAVGYIPVIHPSLSSELPSTPAHLAGN